MENSNSVGITPSELPSPSDGRLDCATSGVVSEGRKLLARLNERRQIRWTVNPAHLKDAYPEAQQIVSISDLTGACDLLTALTNAREERDSLQESVTFWQDRALAAEADRDCLHDDLNALVNCQSPLTRAQMREAAGAMLGSKSSPLPDQSGNVALIGDLKAERDRLAEALAEEKDARRQDRVDLEREREAFLAALTVEPQGSPQGQHGTDARQVAEQPPVQPHSNPASPKDPV